MSWLVDPADFPSRDEALAIIAALERNEAGTWSELATLSGVTEVYNVAHRAFLVYGYPQLEGHKVVQALNAVDMAPRRAPSPPTSGDPSPVPNPLPPADPTPGFTPRR